jgi:hypothetical protein
MIPPPKKKFPVIGPDFAAAKIPDDLQARNLAQDPSAAGLLDRMREFPHGLAQDAPATIRGSREKLKVESRKLK